MHYPQNKVRLVTLNGGLPFVFNEIFIALTIMTPGKKQAFEPTGLIPRSIVRTFERFYKQLLPKTKYSAIREYRISRYQVLVSIRCLCTLLILPLLTRIVTSWLIFPQIQYFWDVTYQEEHVFTEIDQFSQVLFFDSLLAPFPFPEKDVSFSSSASMSTLETKTTTASAYLVPPFTLPVTTPGPALSLASEEKQYYPSPSLTSYKLSSSETKEAQDACFGQDSNPCFPQGSIPQSMEKGVTKSTLHLLLWV